MVMPEHPQSEALEQLGSLSQLGIVIGIHSHARKRS